MANLKGTKARLKRAKIAKELRAQRGKPYVREQVLRGRAGAEALKKDQEAQQGLGSTSVRATSSGLPTLGKRK